MNSYYGPGFGASGYNDPLGSGRRLMPGFGAALMNTPIPGYTPNVVGGGRTLSPGPGIVGKVPLTGSGGLPQTSARQNEAKGIGSFIAGPMDWMGDQVKGIGKYLKDPQNLAAVAQVAGAGLNYMGGRADRNAWQEQMDRERRLEDEERARIEELGPIFAELSRRQGGG